MKYKDILKNKELLDKEVPAEILKMLGLKKKGFEIGEKYYCINSYGKIICDYWDNCEIDIYRLKHGNASKTEEECIFKKEKQEVLAELQEFAEENNGEIDWENCGQIKWYLICNYIYKSIEIFSSNSWKHLNDIYFTSEDLAKQAVAKVGEDRIKKYLFGVV
jgi:hypothetical protein